ncbi:MAG: response regulator transcription factor [Parafilimonas sp.]|nr:response regulator transcription factor [Parafilimonas sp.]
MKNILVADDHSIVRSGIREIILKNFSFANIDEAANENEIVQHVKSTFYDLIVLDINMPDTDFVKLINWLSVTASKANILVFSMHPEEIYAERCLQLGAKGFLHKTASNEEILAAITKVFNGKNYISPALSEILQKRNNQTEIKNPFNALSSRELEIAILINKGHSLPEICTILNIQYSTANTYKRRIFEKLNITNTLTLSRLMQTFNMEG